MSSVIISKRFIKGSYDLCTIIYFKSSLSIVGSYSLRTLVTASEVFASIKFLGCGASVSKFLIFTFFTEGLSVSTFLPPILSNSNFFLSSSSYFLSSLNFFLSTRIFSVSSASFDFFSFFFLAFLAFI